MPETVCSPLNKLHNFSGSCISLVDDFYAANCPVMCDAHADERSLVRVYDKLPADALPLSLQNIWSVIRSQKDLNLPAHKV